ncbi:MAG: M1 family metallopeptidase [Bacteroidales bacterium]|nr:M1 family metallopeptidase [Bacteroidales bacterium]
MNKLRITIIAFLNFAFMLLGAQQQEKLAEIWNEANKSIEEGDYLKGVEYMNKYLEISPFNDRALFKRAVCKLNLADLAGSCEDFNNVNKMGFIKKLVVNYLCDHEKRFKYLKKQYYNKTEVYANLGYRPIYTRADTLRGALRKERTCFDVFYYNLSLRILPAGKKISGTNEIWFKGLEKCGTIQLDLFSNLDIESINYKGSELNYRREYDAVFIDIPGGIKKGEQYCISFKYSGKPIVSKNPPWDGGFVWSRDMHLNRWVGVACEQFGASSWWPCKDHLSDKPDSMGINIEVTSGYQAVSNGTLRDVIELEDGYCRYEWFVNYPINNYNTTFYMGKYSEFTDTIYCESDTLLARYHVLPNHMDIAKEYFKQCNDVVRFYSSAFGPFPFPKDNFRMVESPYAGMEHQTAIAYGDAFNVEKNARTYLIKDFDPIIVHETAHEWWGNAVTIGDMADIWLHEGFATYSEYLFLEHMLGYDTAMAELHKQMRIINNFWPLVQNRDVNENTFAGSDVYNKGAALLNNLRCSINNDSLFMKMLYDFNMCYRDSIIRSEHFIAFVNNATGENYDPLFNKFLYHTDLPVLYYTYTREGDNLRLRFKWTEVEQGFRMPFSIITFGEQERSARFDADTKEKEIVLEDVSSFNFFSMHHTPEKCPHNGLTYFHTHCGNFHQ